MQNQAAGTEEKNTEACADTWSTNKNNHPSFHCLKMFVLLYSMEGK